MGGSWAMGRLTFGRQVSQEGWLWKNQVVLSYPPCFLVDPGLLSLSACTSPLSAIKPMRPPDLGLELPELLGE